MLITGTSKENPHYANCYAVEGDIMLKLWFSLLSFV